MRNIFHSASLLTALVIATPAQAQSAGDILHALGGTSSYGFNCYGRGLSKTLCQIGQADRVVRTFNRTQVDTAAAGRRTSLNDGRILRALAAGCSAGDAYSCQRINTSGMTPAVIDAVIKACDAGDRESCSRLASSRR